MAIPLLAGQFTDQFLDGAVVSFQRFQMGIPSIYVGVKQELREALGLGSKLMLRRRVTGTMPSAAKFGPDCVEYFRRKGRGLIAHHVHDRLDKS